MQLQAGLGSEAIYKKPAYNQIQIGRVTSSNDYKLYGRIEVIFLDYSQPSLVWANGQVDREPMEGDLVLVGWIQGRFDAPYLIGYVRNESYTANFIVVEKDRIILQLPSNTEDATEHMMDDAKKNARAYIELKASEIIVHCSKVTIADGTSEVARKGDTVSVSVPGIGTCTGTITSGTSKVKV